MRRPNGNSDPAALAKAWHADGGGNQDPDAISLDCRLVTPLFGGGVVAGEVDRRLPIRVAGLRGQWRFWWRLLHGRDRSDSRALFREETAIWGGIAADGPVASRVRVRLLGAGTPTCEAGFRFESNPKQPGELKALPTPADWVSAYALFSAQGQRGENRRSEAKAPKELARSGLEFQLAVTFHPDLPADARAEVSAALRWWASFGGIGARTRRGLGAVWVAGLAPVTAQEVQAAGGRLVRRSARDASDAWKTAVDLLREFRQGVGTGRNAGDEPNRPGRSRWPEADTLRALSGRTEPKHAKPISPARGFPRAAFGLPIVFHFKDARDPADHVLEPADLSRDQPRDRLASPLILRPYWDGVAWCAAALLLPGWEAASRVPLKFKEQTYPPTPWSTDAAARAALAGEVAPLRGRGDDALTAFMGFFVNGGR